MSLRSLKILLTGGGGYIGSILTRQLLEVGCSVSVLDNFMYSQNSLMDCCPLENFEVIRGDCRNEALMTSLLKDKDVVIPLAALVGAPLCANDQIGAKTTNLEAIRLLSKLLSPSQWILFPVTNSGYGVGEGDKVCTEDSPLRPISLYGETKVDAERIVLERENSMTFRLATVFGVSPRMRVDLLVNDFVSRAFHDRAVVLFEAHFKRNYIHIRDVAKVFQHGLQNFSTMKGQAYNVGLEEANFSKFELCEVIKSILPQFVFFEAPIGEDPDKRDYIVSNKKILGTGYKPDWTLQDGIRELIKSYTILRRNQFANI